MLILKAIQSQVIVFSDYTKVQIYHLTYKCTRFMTLKHICLTNAYND